MPASEGGLRWDVRASFEERRDQILRSLAAFMRDRRLASLTMRDIADQLGLVKGNLYYYFKSKQDILYHCHVKCIAISLVALDEVIAMDLAPYKNGTDGNIRIATDAIQAAARGHHFLSVHKNGQVAIVQTNGNKDCHVILRGGKAPNYDAASVAAACKDLEDAKLPPTLMVDCSHANSSKQHQKQIDVASDIGAQIAGGSRSVFGVMVESHLHSGAQKFTAGKDRIADLEYGKSITDACLGWDDSVQVLDLLSQAVKQRRVPAEASDQRRELRPMVAQQRGLVAVGTA